MLGALLAIVGVGLITFQPGDYSRLGALLVLSSALVYVTHTAIVKRYGGEIDFVEFFLWRLVATTGFLIALAAGQGALIWPARTAWLILLVTGTLDVVIGRTLYYLALRRIKMSVHSIVLTLSPLAAVLWSALLFGSRPTALDLIGGLAVLVGTAVVTIGRARKTAAADGHAGRVSAS